MARAGRLGEGEATGCVLGPGFLDAEEDACNAGASCCGRAGQVLVAAARSMLLFDALDV